MNKTLPENMADILIQSFVSAFKSNNIDINKASTPIIVTITDVCQHDRTRVGRAVYIEVDGLEFSLAIDAKKEYYRPYKDSELDACIRYNLDILFKDQTHEFITAKSAKEFVDELEAIANEDA